MGKIKWYLSNHVIIKKKGGEMKMRRVYSHIVLLVVVLLGTIALVTPKAFATAVVYDNTTTLLAQAWPGAIDVEVGDEITLAGTERIVTEFMFGYFGDFTAEGDERARIRFYANDGTGGAPNTVLYDSGSVGISTGSNLEYTLGGLSVAVPDTFTWTVKFEGLTQVDGDKAGFYFYDPPTVGSSLDYFWSRNVTVGTWNQGDFGSLVDNLKARVTATSVPEPATLLLLGSGLAGVAVWRKRIGRKEG